MLTANDAIHGWSPAGEDDVEVNVSQDIYFMTINPITNSGSSLSPVCPPLNVTSPKICHPQPKSAPLSPLTGVARAAIAPSSDRRAQRNRNRDPSWIPRPRNAFIIFRCEYSRKHAQSSQESQNDQDSTAAKTLSKRAAEAWKQLPTFERERYKTLADRERDEHARLYPHYRFRPMKRQVSGIRNRSCERSQSPGDPTVESHPIPFVRLPSVLSAAPEKSRSNPSDERAGVSGSMLPATSAPLLEPSLYPIDQGQADPDVPLGVDYSDTMLFYPEPETALPSDSSPSPSTVELYSPLYSSAANIPSDPFRYNDFAFSLDLGHEDPERAQDLEAYAIGLYRHDLFSSFPFPECN